MNGGEREVGVFRYVNGVVSGKWGGKKGEGGKKRMMSIFYSSI